MEAILNNQRMEKSLWITLQSWSEDAKRSFGATPQVMPAGLVQVSNA
jgi:hypothetical protein